LGPEASKVILKEERLRICKESVVAYLKLLSWSRETDKNHENIDGRQSTDSVQKIIGIDLCVPYVRRFSKQFEIH
jgi:hypothetical protein